MAAAPDLAAVVGRERPLGQRLHERTAITPIRILLDDAEPFEAAQHDVVAAVGQPLDMRHDAAAADGVNRWPPLVVLVPARPQQHHPDQPVARHGVGHHLAIARFEDVQRQEDIGEEDDVRQRKQGQKI